MLKCPVATNQKRDALADEKELADKLFRRYVFFPTKKYVEDLRRRLIHYLEKREIDAFDIGKVGFNIYTDWTVKGSIKHHTKSGTVGQVFKNSRATFRGRLYVEFEYKGNSYRIEHETPASFIGSSVKSNSINLGHTPSMKHLLDKMREVVR